MEYPTRKSNRLENYDYSSAGAYFITVCTYGKRCILSAVLVGALHEAPAVRLTEYGRTVEKYIHELPKGYGIEVDRYIIMPNHIHLLLLIKDRRSIRESPLQKTGNRSIISKAVGFLKMNLSRDIRIKRPDENVWQRSFHDHIIRNEEEYLKISEYIEYNAAKWADDCYYSKM